MSEPLRMTLIWLGTVSAMALLMFGWDKAMAKLGRRRIPEGALWAAAALGGGVGAWLGMTLFRHKTRKGAFHIGLPLLAVLQLALAAWCAYRFP